MAVLLCFFLLKDGAEMWAWVLRFVRKGSRDDADEVGNRVYTALSGYVRGIAMVGFVDAVLIAIALVLIGVPLVVPLAIITFFAAFVPLIGAFVAGLLAVLVALVSGGLLDALLVLGAIILVQQVEGHLLYPLLMSRAVHLHPAVIVVALGAGGILAGIVGVFLAVPVAGVISVVLQYAQDRPPPETPLSESAYAGEVVAWFVFRHSFTANVVFRGSAVVSAAASPGTGRRGGCTDVNGYAVAGGDRGRRRDGSTRDQTRSGGDRDDRARRGRGLARGGRIGPDPPA